MGFPTILPADVRAVPLTAELPAFGVPVCILVRTDPSGKPQLEELVNLPDRRCFLGTLGGHNSPVVEWVQIWVQNTIGLRQDLPVEEGQCLGEQLDARWRQELQSLAAADPAALVLTVGAGSKLAPLFIDPQAGKSCLARTKEGQSVSSCRDESLLAQAGLPSFREETWRYLVTADNPPRFVPTEAEAPRPEQPETEAALETQPHWLPLNPQAGPMLVRRHPALSLEDYLELLEGRPVSELVQRKSRVEGLLVKAAIGHQDPQLPGSGGFLLPRADSAGREAEVLYLRLKLLGQVLAEVAGHLRDRNVPLFNLEPASFGVSASLGEDFPFLWTTRCQLQRAGRGVTLRLPGVERPAFAVLGQEESPYRWSGRSVPDQFQARVRIQKVLPQGAGRLQVVATVDVPADRFDEAVFPAILKLRLPMTAQFLDLYGEGQLPGATVGGPARSRSFREVTFQSGALDSDRQPAVASLQAGVSSFPQCAVCLIPSLGPAHDAYSLGVMALRILLGGGSERLGELSFQFDRLAAVVGEQWDGPGSLAEELGRLLADSKEWQQIFGGHGLAGEAADAGPLRRYWLEVLAGVVRLYPAPGKASLFPRMGRTDIGEAVAALEQVRQHFARLAAQARSLVVRDSAAQHELFGVVSSLLAELRR